MSAPDTSNCPPRESAACRSPTSACSGRSTAWASAANLLTVALRRAREPGDPVWLHTCTLDGPAALPNYLARGLVPYRSEISER